MIMLKSFQGFTPEKRHSIAPRAEHAHNADICIWFQALPRRDTSSQRCRLSVSFKQRTMHWSWVSFFTCKDFISDGYFENYGCCFVLDELERHLFSVLFYSTHNLFHIYARTNTEIQRNTSNFSVDVALCASCAPLKDVLFMILYTLYTAFL